MSNNLAIKGFLSHSDKDKKIAADLKEKLHKHGIDLFLAHVDLEGGVEWVTKLFAEVQNCDLFLVLLSKNYHHSNFTDQETGIALSIPKPILPICIDETRPYGFIERYHGIVCNPNFTPSNIAKITKSCKALTKPENPIVDDLIKRLSNAESYSDAHFLAKMLDEQEKFSKKQINAIAKAFLDNIEINQSFMASPIILRILKTNSNKLNEELYNEIF